MDSLPALARIFSNLAALETFALTQPYPPLMPSDEVIWLFPYLASASVTKLHWDIPYLPSRASAADSILVKSIAAGGFPALRSLRAPNDPEGIFQSLCQPRGGQIKPVIDTGEPSSMGTGTAPVVSRPDIRTTASVASNGTAAGKSPTSPGFPPDAMMMPRDHSDLRQSRLAAQARIEAARRFPRFAVNVTDERGLLIETYGIGAFIGTIESRIRYVLTPDAGATDESGGLVSVTELLGDCGESLYPGPKTRKRRSQERVEEGSG